MFDWVLISYKPSNDEDMGKSDIGFYVSHDVGKDEFIFARTKCWDTGTFEDFKTVKCSNIKTIHPLYDADGQDEHVYDMDSQEWNS